MDSMIRAVLPSLSKSSNWSLQSLLSVDLPVKGPLIQAAGCNRNEVAHGTFGKDVVDSEVVNVLSLTTIDA